MKIGWAASAVQTPGGAVTGSVPSMSRIGTVDAEHARVRERAAHERGPQLSRPVEVVDVVAGAADERLGLLYSRCARSQSATSGRVMYGMFAHTWLPSSRTTNSPRGAASACLSVDSHGISRSRRPVTNSAGASSCSRTPSRSSFSARCRASSSSLAPDLCANVSRVSSGSDSHSAPKLNAPLIPATALIRFSNVAARGA